MNLEEKKVLLSRTNIFREWRNKEWWYYGIYDPGLKIYFSFHLIRVNLTDNFTFALFDPATDKPLQFTQNLYFDRKQAENQVDLEFQGRELRVQLRGAAETGWQFQLKNNKFDIQLTMRATTPSFTKYDNCFRQEYTLLHFFHNDVQGTIITPERTYRLDQAIGYCDHCFGKVPSRSGWHWLAVQNRDVALDSLINYGPYAQKYTQVFFKNNPQGFRLNQWIRLNQDVSFEYDPRTKFKTSWQVTSPDLQLMVTPLMHISYRHRIPPLLPCFVNIDHDEFFVKVSGKVRVDSEWVEVQDLCGVMEEHQGKW